MDLPAEDPTATFENHADIVAATIDAETDEEPVLVGHSLAGLTIPLAAARRSVRHLMFLCALLPVPGKSLVEQLASEPEMVLPDYVKGLSEPDAQNRTRWIDFEIARDSLYSDCDPRMHEPRLIGSVRKGERATPNRAHSARCPTSRRPTYAAPRTRL